MQLNSDFDVIIVGGGLSGGLAALALSRAGLAVALVDAADPATMQDASFDGRTTALAYASARAFRRLGLAQAIDAHGEPILDILVSDGRGASRFSQGVVAPLHLHFDSRELASGEPLGFIVENRILRRALYGAIGADGSVAMHAPARVVDVRFGDGDAEIMLEDGASLSAPLVVAADGKTSALRSLAKIKVNRWSYPQTGIVATVSHAEPHKGVAQELFLPSGPFAILPMTDDPVARLPHRSSLVWTEDRDAARALLALEDKPFRAQIQRRFGEYLGEIEIAGPRWSYPLSFHFAQSFIAPRMALIGDAARAIHPIAGQGFNLGVKDIAALAQVLAEPKEVGLDLGHGAVLEKYQRWRRFDSAMLAFGTDALNRLFSNDVAPLRLARDAGMAAVGRVPALRRFFMRQAGADFGRLPPLMQA